MILIDCLTSRSGWQMPAVFIRVSGHACALQHLLKPRFQAEHLDAARSSARARAAIPALADK